MLTHAVPLSTGCARDREFPQSEQSAAGPDAGESVRLVPALADGCPCAMIAWPWAVDEELPRHDVERAIALLLAHSKMHRYHRDGCCRVNRLIRGIYVGFFDMVL